MTVSTPGIFPYTKEVPVPEENEEDQGNQMVQEDQEETAERTGTMETQDVEEMDLIDLADPHRTRGTQWTLQGILTLMMAITMTEKEE